MATGQDLINAACRFLGEPYSTAPGRDNPDSGFKDCSGLIAASYLVATGRPLGANVSVTIYDLAVRNGLWVSFEEARRIPGACLLMPEDPYQGWGPAGHIGFSDGNGGTVEATPPRVQRLSINYQSWGSNACLLPGIDYSGGSSVGGSKTKDDENMRLIRNSDNDEWFLFTDYGWESNIDRARVWNLAASANVPTGQLSGGDIFALAVSINRMQDNMFKRAKEAGL